MDPWFRVNPQMDWPKVNVKDKSVWFLGLGVTSERSVRKGFVSLKPSLGYWTLSLHQRKLVSNNESDGVSVGSKVELLQVGVFLDYDGGWVSFYDAVNMTKLYDFVALFDKQTVYPFFSPGKNNCKGQFQICHY